MFRFTIRDVLWLTVVVALGVTLWTSHQQIEKLEQHAKQLERQSKLWERRASSLRDDTLAGRKFADVEFIPDGLRYVGKKTPAASPEMKPEPNP
jgi:hypothetical protein